MRGASIFSGTSIYGGEPFGAPDSLIRLFGLRTDYPDLMHPGPQGAWVEAQDVCGPFLSFDAPAGF
jgi:hypothetical protein